MTYYLSKDKKVLIRFNGEDYTEFFSNQPVSKPMMNGMKRINSFYIFEVYEWNGELFYFAPYCNRSLYNNSWMYKRDSIKVGKITLKGLIEQQAILEL